MPWNIDTTSVGKLAVSDNGKWLCRSDGEIDGISETWERGSSLGF